MLTDKTIDRLGNVIRVCLISHDVESNGDSANVVDGLFAIARGLESVAQAIHKLGFADASTPMGAIESATVEIRDELDSIACSIGTGLSEVAEALSAAREKHE